MHAYVAFLYLLATPAIVLAQVPAPVAPEPSLWQQGWVFLLAGLVILAVVVWGLAGGIKRKHHPPGY